MLAEDPTQRFTRRADDYARSRPSYPAELPAVLAREAGLPDPPTVADVGAGTGLLTAVLLAHGCRVFAVEPNDAMRAEADARLADRPGYASLAGRAEATELPTGSVDLVTAAQAFHWFDHDRARPEFRRILRPGGVFAAVRNVADPDGGGVTEAFTRLKRQFNEEAAEPRRQHSQAALARFFGSAGGRELSLPNHQELDLAGLRGLLLSFSSMPAAGMPGYEAMLTAAEHLFAEYAGGGVVTLRYRTSVTFGPLS